MGKSRTPTPANPSFESPRDLPPAPTPHKIVSEKVRKGVDKLADSFNMIPKGPHVRALLWNTRMMFYKWNKQWHAWMRDEKLDYARMEELVRKHKSREQEGGARYDMGSAEVVFHDANGDKYKVGHCRICKQQIRPRENERWSVHYKRVRETELKGALEPIVAKMIQYGEAGPAKLDRCLKKLLSCCCGCFTCCCRCGGKGPAVDTETVNEELAEVLQEFDGCDAEEHARPVGRADTGFSKTSAGSAFVAGAGALSGLVKRGTDSSVASSLGSKVEFVSAFGGQADGRSVGVPNHLGWFKDINAEEETNPKFGDVKSGKAKWASVPPHRKAPIVNVSGAGSDTNGTSVGYPEKLKTTYQAGIEAKGTKDLANTIAKEAVLFGKKHATAYAEQKFAQRAQGNQNGLGTLVMQKAAEPGTKRAVGFVNGQVERQLAGTKGRRK